MLYTFDVEKASVTDGLIANTQENQQATSTCAETGKLGLKTTNFLRTAQLLRYTL